MDSHGNSESQEKCEELGEEKSAEMQPEQPNVLKRKLDEDDDGGRKQKAGRHRDDVTEQPATNPENSPHPERQGEELAEILKHGVTVEKSIDLAEILPSTSATLPEDAKKSPIEEKSFRDFDISEKSDAKRSQAADKDEVSVEITKKCLDESEDKRKVTNLRKNIREVMDDNQLDASTLAAQREELERLARVQEQQKIIRQFQRQIDADKINNKMQSKVISLLQGHTSLLKSSSHQAGVAGTSGGAILMKVPSNEPKQQKITNLTPSVSIAPVRGPMNQRKEMSDDEEEREQKINAQIEAEEAAEKQALEIARREVVTIEDSSSEDDCIVLSDDDDEEEETDEDPHNSGLHVKDAYNIPDDQGRVIINIGHPENEPDVFVAPQVARVIKPHQIGGVRFLYDNIIESLDRFDTSTGFGCILAHSMGLGKTLQLVCFCDIFLRHTNSKTVLCIMPVNTLQNWIAEFNMWLPENPEKSPLSAHGEVRPRNFKIHILNDSHKSLSARSKVVLGWARDGGVLMIGYEMFRLLSMKKMVKKRSKRAENNPKLFQEQAEAHKQVLEDIYEALVKPGPDLIVCDEGHRIKNSHASISVALKQIRSKRRIVLTGYPLQNNLMEYWCMVDFVRPNYLGTKTEFANMFERPIQNGQCIDSTPNDIKLMRYRAHVLHSLLLGFVQRRSHVVLQCSLPQKEEYVLLVRMTKFQRELYEVFMNDVVRTKAVPNPLKAFAVCCKIWNHPDVLYNFLKKREADLDLEIEVAEAAAAAAAEQNGTKKGASPKKPKAGKKTSNTKTIDMDGKTKPAATILPTTSSTTTASSSPEKSSAEETSTTETSEPPTPIKTEPTQSGIKQEVHDSSKPIANYPPYNQYPNTSYNYGQYPNQSTAVDPAYSNMYGQGTYYQNQPYGEGYGYGSNPGMPYDQSNYWGSGNDYYQNNQAYGQGYNYNQSSYMMNQQNPQQPYTDPYSSYPPVQGNTNQANTPAIWPVKPEPPSTEPSCEKTSDDKSAAIVDMDTKEIKLEAKSTLPDVEESVDKEKEDENSEKEAKDEPTEEGEKELPRVRDDVIPYDWAVELMKGYVPDLLENSPKMQIFFCILEESIKLGDRILVFSQSLLTLNLIERFLQMTTVTGTDVKWAKNLNYYRLDGSTSALDREKLINEFNSNANIQLFLVSTRAGSLGINLVGANRVIVFDASWNPCHDTQAVCRVYRYGQKKPCFVYRLVMDNCLEKKIYDRQVNKQGMSDRVVDECNPDAHLSIKEVTSLCWDDDKETEEQDFNELKDKFIDLVMQKIMEGYSKMLSKEPFHHESLLVDRKEKKLSSAEKRLAQRGYELEKQASAKPSYGYNAVGTQYRAIRTPDGSIVHRPVASVRPMQSVMNDPNCRQNIINRQTRWIPAEVWQRQGMTAQEMTLPLDVVIPTSSAEKSNIVLKAGQKVMVLKSPKGIYMQLESGKIIAIRTAFKVNHNNKDEKDCEGSSSDMKDSPVPIGQGLNDSMPNILPSGDEDKVIDLDKDNESDSKDENKSQKSVELKQTSVVPEAIANPGNFDTSATIRPMQINQTSYPSYSPSSAPPTTQKIDERVKSNDAGEVDKNTDDVIMLSPEPGESSAKTLENPMSMYDSGWSKQYADPNNQGYPQYPPYQQSKQQHYGAYTNHSQYYPQQQTHPQTNYYTPGSISMHTNVPATQTSFAGTAGGGDVQNNPPTITIDDEDPPLRQKVVYKPNLVGRSKKPPVTQPFHQGYTPQVSHQPYANPGIPRADYRWKSPNRYNRYSPHEYYNKPGGTPHMPYQPRSSSFDPYATPTTEYQPNSLSCLERTTSAIDESKTMYKTSLSNITNSAPLSPGSAAPVTSPLNSSKSGPRTARPRNRRRPSNKSPVLVQSPGDSKPDSPSGRSQTSTKSSKGSNGSAEGPPIAQNPGQQVMMPGQYNPSHPPYYTQPIEGGSYQASAQQIDSRQTKETTQYASGTYAQNQPLAQNPPVANYQAVSSAAETTPSTYSAPVQAPSTFTSYDTQTGYGASNATISGSAFHRPENTVTYPTPTSGSSDPSTAPPPPPSNQYPSGQYQSTYSAQNPTYPYNPTPGGYYQHAYPPAGEYDPARYQPPVPPVANDPQYLSNSYGNAPPYNYPPYPPAPATAPGQASQINSQWQ
ncbi:uncharacterized protein DMENIID0001_017940 [Sergentomyia squamirostris]